MNLGQAPGCHPLGPPHSLFAGYRKLYDLIHSVKERWANCRLDINLLPCKENCLWWLCILHKDLIWSVMSQPGCASGLDFCVSEEKLMRGQLHTQEMAVSSSSSLLSPAPHSCVVMIYRLACPLQWLWCKVLPSKQVAGSQRWHDSLSPGWSQVGPMPFSLLTHKSTCSPRHRRWETRMHLKKVPFCSYCVFLC